MKIFDFRFLMDLPVLERPEHKFTIFSECVSVCDTDFVSVLEQNLKDGILYLIPS